MNLRLSALGLVALVACGGGGGNGEGSGPDARAARIVDRHRTAIVAAIDREANCEKDGGTFFACFGVESQVFYHTAIAEAGTALARELGPAIEATTEPVRAQATQTVDAVDVVVTAKDTLQRCFTANGIAAAVRCQSDVDASKAAGQRLRQAVTAW